MTASFVYDAVRTPFGRAGGALSGIRPDDLAAVVMKATVARMGLDPARIGRAVHAERDPESQVLFAPSPQAFRGSSSIRTMSIRQLGVAAEISLAALNRALPEVRP